MRDGVLLVGAFFLAGLFFNLDPQTKGLKICYSKAKTKRSIHYVLT